MLSMVADEEEEVLVKRAILDTGERDMKIERIVSFRHAVDVDVDVDVDADDVDVDVEGDDDDDDNDDVVDFEAQALKSNISTCSLPLSVLTESFLLFFVFTSGPRMIFSQSRPTSSLLGTQFATFATPRTREQMSRCRACVPVVTPYLSAMIYRRTNGPNVGGLGRLVFSL